MAAKKPIKNSKEICAPRSLAFFSCPASKAPCRSPERHEIAALKSQSALRGTQESTRPPLKPALLDPCAAALDQNDEYYHKQNTSNNPDNQGTVHFDLPLG